MNKWLVSKKAIQALLNAHRILANETLNLIDEYNEMPSTWKDSEEGDSIRGSVDDIEYLSNQLKSQISEIEEFSS